MSRKVLNKRNINVRILIQSERKEELYCMYKLVAIDLDGTLLNSYGEISNKNIETIKKAKEKNVEIVLASGRPIVSVKNLANQIGANNYMICGNGAITYDIQNEKIIYDRFLEKSKVLQIVKICEENSIFYSIYTKDTILTKNLNYNVLFFYKENEGKPDEKKTDISIIQNIEEYIQKRKEEDYLKITICDGDKAVFENIIRKLKTVGNVEVLDVEHMSRKKIKNGNDEFLIEYFYTEITNTNVDKWAALENLINILGIKKEEVITIGDNVNDVLMVKNAGLGVMVENAATYIKENADFIAKDNDSDGVAQTIEKFILKE